MNSYPQSGAGTSNQVFYDSLPMGKSINLSKSMFVFRVAFATIAEDAAKTTYTKNLPGIRALSKMTVQINGTKVENTTQDLSIISLMRSEDLEASYLQQYEPYMMQKSDALANTAATRNIFEQSLVGASSAAWFAIPLSMISGFAAATKSLYYLKELRIEIGFADDLIGEMFYVNDGASGALSKATTANSTITSASITDSYMLYHQTEFMNTIKTQLKDTSFYYIPFTKYEIVQRAGALASASNNINLSGTSIKQIKMYARDADDFEYQLQFSNCEFSSSGKYPPQSQANGQNMIQSFAYDRAEQMNGLDGAVVPANTDIAKTFVPAQRSYNINVMENLGYDVATESSMSGNISFTLQSTAGGDSYLPAYAAADNGVNLFIIRCEQSVVMIDEFGSRVIFTINR
jgi:hypothetical protein